MPSLWDVIQGLERGIREADQNVGVYLSEREKQEESLAKMLEQVEKSKEKDERKRRQDADRKLKLLKEEERQLNKKEGKFSKQLPFLNKDIKKRKSEIRDEIEKLAIEEQSQLMGLSEALSSGEPETSSSKEEKQSEPSRSKEKGLSDFEKEQGDKFLKFMTGGKMSDSLKSVLSAWMEQGEGISGLLGAKDLKKKIRKGKESYEKAVGIDDRDTFYSGAGRLAGDIFGPLSLVGKGLGLVKGASKVPNLAKHLGSGALYGAVQSEKEDENPLVGAAIGGGTSLALQGLGKLLSKGKKAKFAKIKDRATYTDPEEILDRAKTMGKKATIPEIVGDEKLINKIKKDSSLINQSRLSNIEGKIKQSAKDQIQSLPKGEEELLKLYKNTDSLKKEVSEASNQLYDVVKESGIGKEGLLEKSVLKDWMRSMKKADSQIKGLPSMKLNGVKIKDVEKLLMFAPDDPKSYRAFYRQNVDELPTAGDFLKYRSKVNKMLSKADSSQIEGLSNLSEDINRIIDSLDTESTLAKANKNYAIKGAPLKQKEIEKAVTATKFSESVEGRPKASKVFGEQTIDNNLAFKQLPSEDKKRVIGGFLNENLQEEKNPVRAMVETWRKLPDYIKLSKDPEIQKIMKEMKSLANVNKTLSSMQRTTTSDIGSRQAAEKAMKIARWIGYGGTLLTNPTMTAGLAIAEAATKGGLAGKHALMRKGVSQKHLKNYLNPKLLDDVYRRKMTRLQKPAIKPIIPGGEDDNE